MRRSTDSKDVQKDAQYYREVAAGLARWNHLKVDRPLNWAFKSGLAAFAVTVFWTIYKNGYSESVLERALISLGSFGFAGFLLGKFTERPKPLPERPIRWKGVAVSIDNLRSGMILCETVRDNANGILVESGMVLTDELIDVLREYEVTSAIVLPGEQGERGTADGEENGESTTGGDSGAGRQPVD